MPIKYKIYKDLGLLYTFFYGSVDKEDAFDYSQKIYTDPDFPYATKTLAFLKESQLHFNIEDVEEFGKRIINSKKFKLRKKIALLIDSPADTVAATIYAQTLLSYRKGVEVELFYTLEAAIKFLALTDSKSQIATIISENIPIGEEI